MIRSCSKVTCPDIESRGDIFQVVFENYQNILGVDISESLLYESIKPLQIELELLLTEDD